MATIGTGGEHVLRIFHEPLMDATCSKGHRNDIPSGQGKNLRETDEGYEADFSCPDCPRVFSHWVRVRVPPSKADADTLLH